MTDPRENIPGAEGQTDGLAISFELFPVRSDDAQAGLLETVDQLEMASPEFMSVTYGAGGTTQDRTLGTLISIIERTSVPAFGHLTCVGAPRAHVDQMVRRYLEAGVKGIVALRGDPSGGLQETFTPHPEGYENAAALVKGIRAITDIPVCVAAYPEKHPQSPTVEADIDNLKAKIDNGANRAITQFFFDNADLYRYLDRLAVRGINVPVIAGIMPILNFARLQDFAARCGSRIPQSLAERFAKVASDNESARALAVEVAVAQIRDLAANGVRYFHFYTLNRSELSLAICRELGVPIKAATDCAA